MENDEKKSKGGRTKAALHNASSLLVLARELRSYAAKIEELSKRMKNELAANQAMRLNHTRGVGKGFTALKALTNEIDLKLEKRNPRDFATGNQAAPAVGDE